MEHFIRWYDSTNDDDGDDVAVDPMMLESLLILALTIKELNRSS
jgi:hypothetical protein